VPRVSSIVGPGDGADGNVISHHPDMAVAKSYFAVETHTTVNLKIPQ